MSHLQGYNDRALDAYLRGEHGESLRLEAQQVLRGHAITTTLSEEEMAEYLRQRGWVVFKPRTV